MTGQEQGRTGVAGRALVRAIDRLHAAGLDAPRERFRARFLAGACLLALLIVAPALVIEVSAGDPVAVPLLGGFAAALVLQLVALRAGAPVAVLTWTLLSTVGAFLFLVSVNTAEPQPHQLFWLALLPLSALVLSGPRDGLGPPARPSRTPLLALLAAVALGLLVVAAHGWGLTFGRPLQPSPGWAVGLDFSMFMAAASGLLGLHELSARQAQAELAQLRELLAVCAWCKKIQDRGQWVSMEAYLASHPGGGLTHGICPTCLEQRFPSE